MPFLNGYQCAQKIKTLYDTKGLMFTLQEKNNERPLLIACSAYITD